MNRAPDPSLSDYPRPPPGPDSGIKVIVVGAGIGGLSCAIESRMLGHEVLVLEQTRAFLPLGDNIGIFPNSGRLMKRWGIHYELSKACAFTDGLEIRKYDGTHIVFQPGRVKDAVDPDSTDIKINPFADAPLYDTERRHLHDILLKRAKELGATIQQGIKVIGFSENAEGATVEAGGTVYTADVVIGADGVKSKAREVALGILDAPKPSGYSIYRTSYSADRIRANPVCAHLAVKGEDHRTVWIGPDAHFIHGTSQGGKYIHWLLTHLDTHDIEESWMLPGDPEAAKRLVKGWDPVIAAVIGTTPTGALIDWKLVFRDPLPRWVSTGGRIAIMGDAAHPFLPTSQQGASAAVEDGVTIARCLLLAKEKGHPLSFALRAYQSLRYERVRKAQQLGVDNRQMWHKIDWTKEIDPESVKLPYALWLWSHDATAYAIEHYDSVVKEMLPSQMGEVSSTPQTSGPIEVGA
ncbi:hypothetical protein P7C70_g3751, partial [Phenoliferia sp. Uapishka_3]